MIELTIPEITITVVGSLVFLIIGFLLWKALKWLEKESKLYNKFSSFSLSMLGLAATAAAFYDLLSYWGIIEVNNKLIADLSSSFLPGYLELATNAFLIVLLIPGGLFIFLVGLCMFVEETPSQEENEN
ncbi:MAG: hypothetical protein V5A57_02790 [Candidatus Paceibacterota bacterium]